MAKTLPLSVRIAERVAKQRAGPTGKNRAAFLALKPEIQLALADGWPVKTIWETLHEEGKVTFSYQAFRGYVNRLILAAQESTAASGTAIVPGVTTEAPTSPQTPGSQTPLADAVASASPVPLKRHESTISAGFSFNTQPNKEGLI